MPIKEKLTFLLLLIALPASAQTFTRTYGGSGGEYGRWITQTPDSGFAIAGTGNTVTYGVNDIFLVRTDKFGDTLWTRNYGGTANELFASVEVCPDSGFIIAGTTYSFGTGTPASSNWYAIRTNKSGDTLWTKTYGNYPNDLMYHAKPTSDGGFLLMGYTDQGGYAKGTIIKTNATGYPMWTTYMGSSGNSYAYESLEDTNGQYICSGSTLSGTFQVLLQRLNTSGSAIISKTYHSSGQYADGGISIVPAHGGGYMVLGLYGNYGSYNVWLLRVDDNLDTVWTKTLPGYLSVGQLWVKDASIARCAGGYLLCGSGINAGNTDVKLIRVDTLGNLVWTKYHGGPDEHYGYKAIATYDGGFASCGAYYATNISDFFLVKTDSAGNVAPLVPPVAFAGNGGAICSGDTFLLNTATAANYVSLRWYTQGTGSFNDTTVLNPVYYPSAADQSAGTVVLTLKALSPGYNTALSACTLTIHPVPMVTLGPLSPVGICKGDSASLIANLTTGAACTWLWNGMVIPGVTDTLISVYDTGYYKAVATSTFGCADTSDQVVVFYHPVPVVLLGSDTVVCENQVVVLDAGSGMSGYLWSTGHTSQVIQVDSTGLGVGVHSLWVQVTNQYGCRASDTLVLEFADCTSLPEPSGLISLKAWPNPFSDVVIITVPHPVNSGGRILIQDIQGKTVVSEYVQSSSLILDLGHLKPGPYFLVCSDHSLIRRIKLIKL